MIFKPAHKDFHTERKCMQPPAYKISFVSVGSRVPFTSGGRLDLPLSQIEETSCRPHENAPWATSVLCAGFGHPCKKYFRKSDISIVLHSKIMICHICPYSARLVVTYILHSSILLQYGQQCHHWTLQN